MILFSFINNRIILNIILLVLTISCTNQKENVENISPENLSNEVILDIPIDLSIKNILIYPNQFDKNSIYIDAEISSHEGGEGEVRGDRGGVRLALADEEPAGVGLVQQLEKVEFC